MSNKPLHIRSRPKKLEDIVGNNHIVKCLEQIIKRKNRPKVYLLYGHYGCGKTTIAKIIASNVGCNRHNTIEINAGNEKGVETAREIIRMVKHTPLIGETRFIILDEAHALTQGFQQAILTTLEDAPNNVYFALCTTDPGKIIKTIRSRCLELEVKPLSGKEMKFLLNKVIKEQNLGKFISENTISKIGNNADGIPRNALLLLEKVLGLKDLKEIDEILSIDDKMEHQVIDLCRAIMFSKDWYKTRKIMQSILTIHIGNLEQVRLAIVGYIASIALRDNKPNSKAMLVYECFKDPFYGNDAKAKFIFACLYVLKS